MTFDEAIGELGLEPNADADTARRTYLRLIKVRKPETDPKVIQAARERLLAIVDQHGLVTLP